MKDEDVIALAEAVLDSANSNYVTLVKELREASGVTLRAGINMANFALMSLEARGHPRARAVLERKP